MRFQVNHSSGLLEDPDPLERGPYDAGWHQDRMLS